MKFLIRNRYLLVIFLLCISIFFFYTLNYRGDLLMLFIYKPSLYSFKQIFSLEIPLFTPDNTERESDFYDKIRPFELYVILSPIPIAFISTILSASLLYKSHKNNFIKIATIILSALLLLFWIIRIFLAFITPYNSGVIGTNPLPTHETAYAA